MGFDAAFANASSPRTEIPLQIESYGPGNKYTLPSPEECESGVLEEYLCDPPHRYTQPGADSTLKLGVLIQGRYKVIVGYPGWHKSSWDGWPQPVPDDHLAVQPSVTKFCEATPCLFDIVNDPTEHNDI